MKKLILIFLTALSLSGFGQASQIGYADKDKNLPLSDPRRNFTAENANEIKSVTNANAVLFNALVSTVATKAPISSPTFTTGITTPLIKVTSGSPGAGKVLTSDADGDATWETPSAAVGSISGLGTGVLTWLVTPSSANLAAAVTNETGSGALVFGTSPNLTTPALGTPSALVLTNATGLPGTATINVPAGNISATTLQAAINELDAEKVSVDLSTIFVDGETPSGVIDGVNLVFTLANTPTSGSLKLYNAIRLRGGGVDYSLSGPTITFTTAPEIGSILLADYRK